MDDPRLSMALLTRCQGEEGTGPSLNISYAACSDLHGHWNSCFTVTADQPLCMYVLGTSKNKQTMLCAHSNILEASGL